MKKTAFTEEQIAYINDTPSRAFGYFTAAFLLAFACAVVLLALFLVTNTRRPRGIDPDQPLGPVMGFDKATIDAFALSTDDILKHEKKRVRASDLSLDDEPKERPRRSIVIDERGEPYGRRKTDIPVTDIKRTIEAVRQIKGAGGAPEEIISVPDWAKALITEGEQANGTAQDAERRGDQLDLQPPGDEPDRPAGDDDQTGSREPGLPRNPLSTV